MKVVVIQGPNLNMLGIREQRLYGPMRLDQIHQGMQEFATHNGMEVEFFQSNFEGEIVDKIQECMGTADGIIINPAAYSHTSIAIRDALLAVGLPTVEVHITNIHGREEFRHRSLTGEIATGMIVGLGPFGYHLAMISMHQILSDLERYKKGQEAQQSNQA